MKRIFSLRNLFISSAVSLLLCGLGLTAALGYVAKDFHWVPPLASAGQQPVTHIVFDSSGSMRFRAHQDANNKYNYDLNKEYYGYANNTAYYRYHADEKYFEPAYEDGKPLTT